MTTSVTVRTYMTPSPHTIGADQPISRAQDLFRQFGIRHLPVLRGGRLQGVVSERDIALVQRLAANAVALTIEDVMTSDVYEVSPHAALADIAREMAARKLGSAIVVERDAVVGIVTTVDLCAALGDVLRDQIRA